MSTDTGKAKLPALPPVNANDPTLRNWMNAVAERLEVREGSRGNPAERVITQREFAAVQKLVSEMSTVTKAGPDDVALSLGNGLTAVIPVAQFADAIMRTRLWKDLQYSLDDPRRFDYLSSELRALVEKNIAEEAAARGADIKRTDLKIQDLDRSLAATVTEVTAALRNNSSGIRELTAAYVSATSATAVKLTQLSSSLGNYYQDGTPGRASLEQTLLTQAEYSTGLRAQYTLKLSAGGAIAGFGLAATEFNGVPSSAFIIQADKFAIVSPSYVGGLTTTPNTNLVPFGVDANGVYINGQVRINTGGSTLSTLATNAATPPITYIGSYASAPSTSDLKKNSVYKNTTDGNSYILSADNGVWQLYLEKGSPGTSAQTLSLSFSGQAFVYTDATSTTSSSATITFTANLQNVTGTATFTATAYTSAGASLGTITLGGSGNARTLTSTQFNSLGATTTAYVVVTATLSGLSDTATVVRVNGGADSITAFLTNEAHTVQADTAGTVSSFAGAATQIKVFRGAVDDTINWSFSKVDSNLTTSLTGNGSSTVTVTATAMSADSGTSTITGTRTGYSSVSKVFTVTKAKAGLTGAPGSAGAPGANGTRGSITAYASGSSWSDTTADNAITTFTGSSTKVVGDTVTISNGTTFAATKYWSATAWVDPGVVIDGNLLVNGTISGNKIGANTITADKINGNNLVVTNGTFSGSLSAATGTFSGLLNAAKIQVGTTAAGVDFIDPNQPSVPLLATGSGFLAYTGDTGTSTYVSQTCTDGKGYTYDCSYYVYSGAPISSTSLLFTTGSLSTDISRRIKTGSVRFLVTASGTVDHYFSLWYRALNVDGSYGAWIPIAASTEPQSGYGSCSVSATGVLGFSLGQGVQFGFAATDTAGNYQTASARNILDGTISVLAFNF